MSLDICLLYSEGGSAPRAIQPRPATTGECHQLAFSLAAAFQGDPVFSWLLPNAKKRPAGLRRFFSQELRHVLRHGYAWSTSELAGTALTLPPGAWRTPPLVALLQGQAFGIHITRAAGLLATVELRHLHTPHWYFPYIGVAPKAQGEGLGSRLMKPILERCDAESLPAYLEASSERNAALYERLGFLVKRELRFASSPPLRLMVRPPQS